MYSNTKTMLAAVLAIALVAPAALAQNGGGSQEDPANQIEFFLNSTPGAAARGKASDNAYATPVHRSGRVYMSDDRVLEHGRATFHPTDWDSLGAY